MMGGFFGLELPGFDNFPYREGLHCAYVNSGRAAFEILLSHLPRPSCVWVPHFICDTALQAPQRLGIPVRRYPCTEQLAPLLPSVQEHEVVLLVNYFGLTGSRVAAAAEQLPGQCIVDATTALFTPPLHGVPTFYSPRKFSGVADGGIACSPTELTHLPEHQYTGCDTARVLLERLEFGAAKALPASEQAELSLQVPPCGMSRLSRKLLAGINFEAVATQRLQNYKTLHEALKGINRLELPDAPAYAPMCYPLVCGIPGMRDHLIDSGIALPIYWPEVIENCDAITVENKLARTLLPLPLDQRYKINDMKRLIELILG